MDELNKILEASNTLFRKYGIRSVTMADIAQELGVSKKTLYRYIENKHDLVTKIMQSYLTEEREMCNQMANEAKNALDELLKISVYVQHQIKDINPALIYDLQKYHRPVWEMMDGFHKNYILSMAEDNLRRGVEEGLYRKDLHIQLVAKVYVSLILVISDSDNFPLNTYPTHTVHKEFIKYHIHGIISEQGKQILKELLEEHNLSPDIL